MDLEVKAESAPDATALSIYNISKYLLGNDLTDLQRVFILLLNDILLLFASDLTESEWGSKLIPKITEWISVVPSVSQSVEHVVLELESLIAQKTISFSKLKSELISLTHQIYSIVVSSPESKSKWLKRPKNLICLSPKLQLHFEKGKFDVTGDVEWNNNCDLIGHGWIFEWRQGIYFLCRCCNGKYHEEIKKAPVEIKNHYLHPKHQLQLATTADPQGRSRECYCCDDDLLWAFYYCSTCDFAVNVACVEKPPLLLAIDHPKWHEHTLALFARHVPLNCSLCALADLSSPVYMCPPCGFVAHLRCLRNLPRVVRISRHPHRISFTHSYSFDDQGEDWSCSFSFSCSVCRTKMDNDYGGYSCIKDGCSYAAHSKCATQSNIWDGKELEGQPEEVEEEAADPFVRISDGVIQHFSHQHHHLRLIAVGDYDDDDKQCQACSTPIYFGGFYSCTQCDFILHEACANLCRKIHHPIHPHQLVLVGEYDAGGYEDTICSACPANCTGFSYKCCKEECRFKLHVQCATISEPLVHESHIHPLFLTSKPGEHRTCSVCNTRWAKKETFNCIECEEFSLCFGCATLPHKVRYKYDKHMLTLSYGEETTSSMAYWCEACEKEINTKQRFYKCDEYCCVTLHIECLLGRTLYMRPGSSFSFGRKILDVVRNNHMSRPICETCMQRCSDRVYFHHLGSIFCSLHCSYGY